MAITFEGYERRIDQFMPVLNKYGIKDLEEARKILGKNKIIGVSVGSVEEALKAERGGADYLGIGTDFYTGS